MSQHNYCQDSKDAHKVKVSFHMQEEEHGQQMSDMKWTGSNARHTLSLEKSFKKLSDQLLLG